MSAPPNHFSSPGTVVVGILVSLSMVGCSDEQTKTEVIRPVRTASVTASPATTRRTYPAVVLPTQQAELAFKVSGRIVELPIRAAAEVKKGDTIAQLDKRDFESAVKRLESQLDQANAQLAEMKAGAREEDMAKLEAKVKAAESQVATQKTQVDRTRRLREQGAASPPSSESVTQEAAAAGASADTLRADLSFQVENIELERFGFLPQDELRGGSLQVAIDLTGSGASSAALASSLDGELLFMVRDATLANDVIELAGSDLIMETLSKLNPFVRDDPSTELRCALAQFSADDGVLKTNNGLVMETTTR